ncbi:MAG: hypothetical protein NUK65_10200 [Firmicutes bacterium]|nr:hypothetical protein [Bacillota bacterium]
MIKLICSCILLVIGMMVLPPLSGAGAGSVVTRVWLAFGVVVFFSHHLSFLKEFERAQMRQQDIQPRFSRRLARQRVRS